MPGRGWVYARDQTEAGEVKGGAAAAAAKVQNQKITVILSSQVSPRTTTINVSNLGDTLEEY